MKKLLKYLQSIKNSPKLMDGLEEVLVEAQREWVKTKLLDELKNLIRMQIDYFGQQSDRGRGA